MPALYNEIDPFAAQWLRNLVSAGHLPAGDVDERSILDLLPEEINRYEQFHAFAGIGVWPYALRAIGWPDNRRIWTGSCPCQPFSAAGRQLGFTDERHLWPAWYHLITQCEPTVIAGEQVSSAGAWLDLISTDLENANYSVGAADLCAAGFPVASWEESPQHEWLLRALYDCPDPMVAAELLDFAAFASANLGGHDGDHIRSRYYFVGVADESPDGRRKERADNGGGREGNAAERGPAGYGPSGDLGRMADDRRGRRQNARIDAGNGYAPIDRAGSASVGGVYSAFSGVEHGEQSGLEGYAGHGHRGHEPRRVGPQPNGPIAAAGYAGGLENNSSERLERGLVAGRELPAEPGRLFPAGSNNHVDGAAGHAPHERRGAADWIFCRDGKWRPVGPGAFPLANEAASRVGRLRAYGNALDGETVKAFLSVVRECIP